MQAHLIPRQADWVCLGVCCFDYVLVVSQQALFCAQACLMSRDGLSWHQTYGLILDIEFDAPGWLLSCLGGEHQDAMQCQ